MAIVKRGVMARTTWWNCAGHGQLLDPQAVRQDATHRHGDEIKGEVGDGDVDRIESRERDEDGGFPPRQPRWREEPAVQGRLRPDGAAEGVDAGQGPGKGKVDEDDLVVEGKGEVGEEVEN
jgi:hypothetical protein